MKIEHIEPGSPPAAPAVLGQEGEPGAQIHLGTAEGEDASPLCQRCDESGSKGKRAFFLGRARSSKIHQL
jgi:hypothetical protein